ncbi:MAG TPA: biotin carboxylase N-terminal domain-containing protein [Actinomycetes bacterium]
MFTTVLVANRGEIAVRVIRTLRAMGIRSATVFSDADAHARHVREADVAVRIGPAAATRSYLDVDAVVAAARSVGAEAIHPGYGFLSERAELAVACDLAGIAFIGPPAEAIAAMGDKVRAKQLVEKAGVPVVPGRHEPGLTDDDLVEAAHQIGFPVLLKPSAGGGGKGMRRVADPADLADAIGAARREARSAFGDDTMLVERWVDRPRHIEIQVLVDSAGHAVHLGERECSLQRRHQKVVEEAPSPLLTPQRREAMGASAVQAALSCGYVGAGTVEFIVPGDSPDEYFFMEMNTRLQVEHPVTELVTGVDLVEEQVRCAAGLPLRFGQADVRMTGHAVEARVYAEDPAADFLPSGGRVLALAEPDGAHVRVDSGIEPGTVVGSDYDPMLAKVVAWGEDRAEALQRLDHALARTVVLGVVTNLGFLRSLLAAPEVRSAELDTGLIERRLDDLVDRSTPRQAAVAAALGHRAEREAAVAAGDLFGTTTGWRVGEHAWTTTRLRQRDQQVEVRVRGAASAAEVSVDGDDPTTASALLDGGSLHLTLGGMTQVWSYARDDTTVWVGHDGHAWAFREVPEVLQRKGSAAGGAGPVLAPMPGTVTLVHVTEGATVTAGEPLAAVEAMKMEHVVRAPADGVVEKVLVRPGQAVPIEAPLVVLGAGVTGEAS